MTTSTRQIVVKCSDNPCKRCGCDFPNIPRFKRGCGACETPNEMLKRVMGVFK